MTAGSDTANADAMSAVRRHQTPEDALIDALEQCMRQTGLSLAQFAQELTRQYNASVPPDQQQVTLPLEPAGDTYDDYMRWIDGARKQVQRYIAGDVRFPLQLAPAWIAALPDPHRTQARHDLTACFGLLAVPIPDEEVTPADLGNVLKESAEEHMAASEVFADGVIDERDEQALVKGERECRESAAASLGLGAKFRAALAQIRQGRSSN